MFSFGKEMESLLKTKRINEIQQNGFLGKRGAILRFCMTLDRRIPYLEKSSEVSAGANPKPNWKKKKRAFPKNKYF